MRFFVLLAVFSLGWLSPGGAMTGERTGTDAVPLMDTSASLLTSYRFVDVAGSRTLKLRSGAELRFIDAPFLHFAGAITTFASTSGFLF